MTRVAHLAAGLWIALTGLFVPGWNGIPLQPIAGLLVMASAVLAFKIDAARWVSTLAGAWLVVAPFLLPIRESWQALNCFVAGLLVMLLASYPTELGSYEEPTAYNQSLYRHHGEGRAIR